MDSRSQHSADAESDAPADRFERLLASAADLARSGPAGALVEVLKEADRLIVRQGERLASDPAAAARLRGMRAQLQVLSESLEMEQRRIAGELGELQALAQAQSRFTPPLPVAGTFDRRA